MAVPPERRCQHRRNTEHARLVSERERVANAIRAHDRTRNARANGMTNWAIHRARKLRRIDDLLRRA